jgi:hypothetical protein
MLIVDVSKVKLPSGAKQSNLPPECGQRIEEGEHEEPKKWILYNKRAFWNVQNNSIYKVNGIRRLTEFNIYT